MTPIGLNARNKLSEAYTALDREKITHWLMNFSERGVNIDPGGGRSRISISGVQFEGQVRDIFWSCVEPSLNQAISETFQNAAFDGKIYTDVIALKGIEEATAELKGLV